MLNYKTVKEKAAQWDTSPRHLQYLCQKERIEGAIKKAGVWLIPDDAAIPVQYTKWDVKNFNFVGTKKRIFDCATKLIKEKGFEAVSIKDIADCAGITQSSVYNHFKSKQEILDTIYDFYCFHYLNDRPGFDELDPILQSGSLIDIMKFVTYDFKRDHAPQMSDITAIVFYRCALDDRARKITKSLMVNEGVRFVEDVFERAVEVGRIAPMDIHAMAVFINSIRIYMLHNWIVDPLPESSMKLVEEEGKLYQYASIMLKDLKFPNEKI